MLKVRSLLCLFAAFFVLVGPVQGRDIARVTRELPVVTESNLPLQARLTLENIRRGGPFAFDRDGVTFGNYEKALPLKARGYYHEFTVAKPNARHRGAKRIIVGGNIRQPVDYFYTDNHYATFSRILP